MLNENSKQICLQSIEVFEYIFNTLNEKHPVSYAREIATELTKIVFYCSCRRLIH